MRKRNWHELLPEAELTAVGSLAYKLALVAAGRFDGLVSLRGSHDWDLAAARLLIDEAGARLTDAGGAPLVFNQPVPRHAGLVAAGTDALHSALLARLNDLRGRAQTNRR
jgi:myo-inositol-1(or 4)-monophosphatase